MATAVALIGHPAVKLFVATPDTEATRTAVSQPEPRSGRLPVVLVLTSIPPKELPAVETEIAEQLAASAPAVSGERPVGALRKENERGLQ